MALKNSRARIALMNMHRSKAADDLDAAAEMLIAKAHELKRAAQSTRDLADRRTTTEIRNNAVAAAFDVLDGAARPIAPDIMNKAIDSARMATLFQITAETAEIWIRDAIGRNSSLERSLRDRRIMRRYLAGRSNEELAAEFNLSKAQIGRIIRNGKNEALRR